MEISPVILEGQHVRLEPLSPAHEESLIAAAGDGELWNSNVTVVPARTTMGAYIEAALEAQAQRDALPFVIIRKASDEVATSGQVIGASGEVDSFTGTAGGRGPQTGSPAGVLVPPASGEVGGMTGGEVVGTTRFYDIRPADRRVAIGYTWLSASAQRTAVNTEAKLLLLTHAFEHWRCYRVEFITDLLNQQSRTAILRLGAKQEGVLRNHMIMPGGRIRDSAIFSIITEEWPEVKTRLAAKLALTAWP